MLTRRLCQPRVDAQPVDHIVLDKVEWLRFRRSRNVCYSIHLRKHLVDVSQIACLVRIEITLSTGCDSEQITPITTFSSGTALFGSVNTCTFVYGGLSACPSHSVVGPLVVARSAVTGIRNNKNSSAPAGPLKQIGLRVAHILDCPRNVLDDWVGDEAVFLAKRDLARWRNHRLFVEHI